MSMAVGSVPSFGIVARICAYCRSEKRGGKCVNCGASKDNPPGPADRLAAAARMAMTNQQMQAPTSHSDSADRGRVGALGTNR